VFFEVLKKVLLEQLGEIAADRYTVADKIDFVLGSVRGGGALRFSRLFSRMASRSEIICTFLALLELLRLHQIAAVQDARFGDIVITGTDSEQDPDTGGLDDRGAEAVQGDLFEKMDEAEVDHV